MTAEDAIRAKADAAFTVDKTGNIFFDTNHSHYYQMKSQVHIAQRSYCWYIVWTPKGFKMERVARYDDFWKNSMVQQLTNFYHDCLLPDIVEQSYLVGKPIKNHQYLLHAVAQLRSRLNKNLFQKREKS